MIVYKVTGSTICIAEQEKIELVPTLVIYQNGAALGSIVAPESKAKIDAFIAQTLP